MLLVMNLLHPQDIKVKKCARPPSLTPQDKNENLPHPQKESCVARLWLRG